MNCYRGKLRGKRVSAYGHNLRIHQGRVSETNHDHELRKPSRRHHIFFDVEKGISDNDFRAWVEVWDFNSSGIACYRDYTISWRRYPTIGEVCRGIGDVIEKNIKTYYLKCWLKRMRPVRRQRKKKAR